MLHDPVAQEPPRAVKYLVLKALDVNLDEQDILIYHIVQPHSVDIVEPVLAPPLTWFRVEGLGFRV